MSDQLLVIALPALREDAMSKFNREELERFVKANPPAAAQALLNRKKPNAPSERVVQLRKETLKVVEDALERAGIDVEKIRRAFVPEPNKETRPRFLPPEMPVTSGRLRRMKPLAGLTVPLQPPLLIFFDAPDFFTKVETENYLVESSIESNNTIFRASFFANDVAFGRYTFTYVWYNESDAPMLTNVSTALDLLGGVFTEATSGYWRFLSEVWTEVNVEGGLTIMVGGDPSSAESVVKGLADVSAETDFFIGVAEQVEIDQPVNESQGMSIDGFIVPGHSTLIIQVWTQFEFFLTFGGSKREGVQGGADFSTGQNRVSCPGVVIVAQPMQVPPSILL
jgi:hypothetical protein